MTSMLYAQVTPPDQYGALVWLLWAVLLGVGGFIAKVGYDLVKSIQANTTAVVSLTGKIEKLCEQQATANSLIQSNMAMHAGDIKTQLREGLRDLADEVRRATKRSRGDGPPAV